MTHPARVGKYEVEEFLGGGMSHVYRARDTILGRTVAIKILTPSDSQDQDVRNRFKLEAATAANIRHENVIRIYDFGEDDGQPFLVMEFLRGNTLRKLIDENRTGSLRDRLSMARQLASALEHIHSLRIIHRDIKPDNVHVDERAQVKLMDFGIVKAEGLSMTQAGFVIGTPHYMAPEQVRGEEVTPLVDVYAFGILLYELFTGRKPYTALSAERVFYCIVAEPPDTEPLVNSDAPPEVRTLILHCLKKKPEDRPRGFTEICAELDRSLKLLEGTSAGFADQTMPMPTPVASRAPGGSSRRWIIAGLSGLSVIALLVAWILWKGSASKESVPPVASQPATLQKSISTPAGEMLLIPAGEFLSGQNRQPARLPAYYMDKTEVSNAAYSAYCAATGCTPPEGAGDLPVTRVTIDQARRFAQWAGKRIPTDPEWEKAARGVDGRKFPWGNDADPAKANLNGTKLVPVDGFPNGASVYGVLQMAGNVAELVDTSRTPSPQAVKFFQRLKPPATANEPWITIRGGGYGDDLEAAVTWEFSAAPARFSSSRIGFRCVKDAKP